MFRAVFRSTSGRAATAASVLLVVLAAWLRLDGIASRPAWLFPDEAAEGFDAWRLLHVPGFHPLFFDDDGGREPLFAYLVAGVFRVAGDSPTALRATAAAVGVLGVAATAVALRRLGEGIAVTATAWAAGSLWLVVVDRDGFRNALVPLVGTLVLGALLLHAERPGRRTAVLAGALAGLGLWTYQPLKLIPLWIILWLLWTRRRRPDRWAALRPTVPTLAAAWVVVAAPMLYVAVTDPTGWFGRGLSVSAASPDQHLGGLPLHALRTLAAFGILGDPNARHDIAGVALLPPAVALLAGLGGWRAWRHRDDPRMLLLLTGIPVFLLPALVALEGDAPHFLRVLGLAPVLAALVGLGAPAVRELLDCRLPARGAAVGAAVVVGAVLAAMTVQSARLERGRTAAEMYGPYSGELTQLSAAGRLPGTTVVIDDYRGLVVDFLDRTAPPPRARPGVRIEHPVGAYVARDPGALDSVLGPGAAERAEVIARDPAGRPAVWRVAA